MMEVHADLAPLEDRQAAERRRFDRLWTAHVETIAIARYHVSAAVAEHCFGVAAPAGRPRAEEPGVRLSTPGQPCSLGPPTQRRGP